MDLREDILALAEECSGKTSNGTEQSDLLGAFGLEGEDANEFLEKFALKFDVDLSSLRCEFHYIADEPPGFRRVLPVDQLGKVIPFAPIRLEQLFDAAETGRWAYAYPEHRLRMSRLKYVLFAFVLALFAGVYWVLDHVV